MMAAELQASPTFQAGSPRELFQIPIGSLSATRRRYAVSADGQRFLVHVLPQQQTEAPITVVLNWWRKLKK